MNPEKCKNKIVNRYQCYDISLIKLSTAAFVLMVAKLWPPLLNLDWYWYGIIAIVAAIIPARKYCGCSKGVCKKCQSDPCECKENNDVK
ncbi:hypothetical protein N9W34_00140 [Rickettsiales bacterium]|nr:hypothetical protein [Rickettsiales bacterium]